jgi:hypothetical protein
MLGSAAAPDHGVMTAGRVGGPTLLPETAVAHQSATVAACQQRVLCRLRQANVASLLPVPGNLVIVALLAPLVALAMLRNVAALAPYSLAADIAMISGALGESLASFTYLPPARAC